MTIKRSGKVTVTFNRTTVEKLRSEKGEMAWDAFMLNLIGGMKQGVRARCIRCGKIVESTDIDVSLRILTRRYRWKEVLVRGKSDVFGFVCDKCNEIAVE